MQALCDEACAGASFGPRYYWAEKTPGAHLTRVWANKGSSVPNVGLCAGKALPPARVKPSESQRLLGPQVAGRHGTRIRGRQGNVRVHLKKRFRASYKSVTHRLLVVIGVFGCACTEEIWMV